MAAYSTSGEGRFYFIVYARCVENVSNTDKYMEDWIMSSEMSEWISCI